MLEKNQPIIVGPLIGNLLQWAMASGHLETVKMESKNGNQKWEKGNKA